MAGVTFQGLQIPDWVFYILIIIGLIMALFGRAIWDFVLSMIGGILGSLIGFVVGFILGGLIGAIVGMFVLGFIGSLLFKYLMRVVLALLAGVVISILVWYGIGKPMLADFAPWALLIIILVFIPSYWFIEELISLLTALIGGAIVGVGVYCLTWNPWVAFLVGILVWVGGTFLQIMALEKYDRVHEGL